MTIIISKIKRITLQSKIVEEYIDRESDQDLLTSYLKKIYISCIYLCISIQQS